jgi:hypothetical protein
MQVGLFLTMVVEGLIIAEAGSTLVLWCVLGVVSATGAQMYGWWPACFPAPVRPGDHQHQPDGLRRRLRGAVGPGRAAGRLRASGMGRGCLRVAFLILLGAD